MCLNGDEKDPDPACAPYCTVSCVHQVSVIDRWRDRQTLEFSGKPSPLVQVDTRS